MPRKQTVVLSLDGTHDGTTTYELTTNAHSEKQTLCVQCISAANEDTKTPDIHVGVKRGTRYNWIQTLKPSGRGQYVRFHGTIWIPGDYQVAIRFGGSSSGDVCHASVFGYYQDNG